MNGAPSGASLKLSLQADVAAIKKITLEGCSIYNSASPFTPGDNVHLQCPDPIAIHSHAFPLKLTTSAAHSFFVRLNECCASISHLKDG